MEADPNAPPPARNTPGRGTSSRHAACHEPSQNNMPSDRLMTNR